MSEEQTKDAPKAENSTAEPSAETPKVESNPTEAAADAQKPNVYIPQDTPGDRTVCTILLVAVMLLLIRAIMALIEYEVAGRRSDPEGLTRMVPIVDWLIACICNAVVIGKSLGRLKWMFFKVTMAISLLFAIVNIVLFFFM